VGSRDGCPNELSIRSIGFDRKHGAGFKGDSAMYSTTYTFGAETKMTVPQARQKVEELLKEEGFGILTEIDVAATLKKKIDVDFRPYLILGACNPKIAHQALGLELEIGSLLPCNVIVYQNDKGGTNIAFMDPLTAMESTGNKNLSPNAQLVKEKLMKVAKKLGAS
jgi:uncharacterized protein (DUF302 family)